MALKKILFPEHSRSFIGQRWFDIFLRTIHLTGLLGVAGGVIFNAEPALYFPYFLTTVLSGTAMLILNLWSNFKWLLQNRGLVIITKVFILTLLPLFTDIALYLLFFIVLVSGFSSHASSRFRYYSPILGKSI